MQLHCESSKMPNYRKPGIISARNVVHFQDNRPFGRVKETGTVAGLHEDDDVEVTMLQNLDLGQTHENSKIGEELDVLVGLNHPYVVAILGVCLSPLCLVTERFPERSLNDVMKTWQNTDTSPKKKLELLEKIAEGMEYLHNREPPVLHKNLKPTNVMMKGEDTPVITGFGFHMYRRKGDEELDPIWLACEVAKQEEASTKSDVYSFGIILWEVLSGKKPWDGEHKWSIRYHLERGQHPVLAGLPKIWAGYGDLVSLVNQCLSTAPADRPDFSEIVRRLKYILWKMEHGEALVFAGCSSRLMGGCGFVRRILLCGCCNHSTPREEEDEVQKRSSDGFNEIKLKKDDAPDDLHTRTRQKDTDENAISFTRLKKIISLAIGWGEHCEKIQDSDWQEFFKIVPGIDAFCCKEITKLKVPKKASLMKIRQFLISHINMEANVDMQPVQEEHIDRWIGSCHGIHHSIWKKLPRLVLASLEANNDDAFKELFETVDNITPTSSSV